MIMGFLAGSAAMMRWFLIGFLVFFLSGCVSRWEHSTKRTSEFYDDDRSCQAETGGASVIIEPGGERMSYESCMWEKGWRKKASVWFFDPGDQ